MALATFAVLHDDVHRLGNDIEHMTIRPELLAFNGLVYRVKVHMVTIAFTLPWLMRAWPPELVLGKTPTKPERSLEQEELSESGRY
jgi:hypothetical protein